MPSTNTLLINLILYGILPLWGISGLVDWFCHRASDIEYTSGLKESLLHSLMGIQIGTPIVLGLFFEVNGLILLICIGALVSHTLVAHWDVSHSAPVRRISIWEVHVHNYLATIPLYLLALIVVINWDVVLSLLALDWQGQFRLMPTPAAQLTSTYKGGYLCFMAVVCVFPYLEENLRCLLALREARS